MRWAALRSADLLAPPEEPAASGGGPVLEEAVVESVGDRSGQGVADPGVRAMDAERDESRGRNPSLDTYFRSL